MSLEPAVEPNWMLALAELSSRLSGAITRDQAIGAVVAGAREATGATHAAYGEVQSGRVVLLAERGLSSLLNRYVAEMGVPDGSPMAEAALTNRLVQVPSLDATAARYPDIFEIAEASGLEAMTEVPISIGGRVTGVVHLGFDGVHRPSPGETEFLAALSSLAGQSIESVETREREARVAIALAEVETEVQVAELVSREARLLFGADRVALHMLDPVSGGLALASAPAGDALYDRIGPDDVTLASEAFWSGRPVTFASKQDYLRRYPDMAAGREGRIPASGLAVSSASATSRSLRSSAIPPPRPSSASASASRSAARRSGRRPWLGSPGRPWRRPAGRR
jgi:hypothetical protein